MLFQFKCCCCTLSQTRATFSNKYQCKLNKCSLQQILIFVFFFIHTRIRKVPLAKLFLKIRFAFSPLDPHILPACWASTTPTTAIVSRAAHGTGSQARVFPPSKWPSRNSIDLMLRPWILPCLIFFSSDGGQFFFPISMEGQCRGVFIIIH